MKEKEQKRNKDANDGVPASVLTEESLERLRAKNRRGRVKRAVLLFVAVVAVIAIFIALCVFVFFKIESITVSGTEIYTPEEIIEISGVSVGDNLFTVNSKDVSSRISSEFSYIGSTKLKRHIPGTLEIAVSEDSAVFYTEIFGEYFALTEDLRVLQSTDTAEAILEKYPSLRKISLSYVASAIVGSNITFDNENYFTSLSEFIKSAANSGYYDSISDIDFTNRFAIKMTYKGRFSVSLGDSKSTDVKLNFVEAITNELGENAKASIEMNDAKKAYVIVETR